MSRILAIDLGKFKSVTCLLDSDTNQTEFWTMATDRHYLLAVLKNYHPDLVVIESCGLSGLRQETSPHRQGRRAGNHRDTSGRSSLELMPAWLIWRRRSLRHRS